MCVIQCVLGVSVPETLPIIMFVCMCVCVCMCVRERECVRVCRHMFPIFEKERRRQKKLDATYFNEFKAFRCARQSKPISLQKRKQENQHEI